MTIALLMGDVLTGLGDEVVGLATPLPQVWVLAAATPIDFAILNLDGPISFCVADLLRRRGAPFVIAAGYGSAGLDDAFRGQAGVEKKPSDCKPCA